ncbi:MAG: hypothetical protein INR73_19020 [Williamsia sp.]|nr:hypothetical protein [Williamsia sp.]
MQAPQETKETMFAHIRQWQASGASQKAFCQANQIRYHVFHYWYSLFKKTDEKTSPAPASFVRLDVPNVPADLSAELSLPAGTRITFYQPVSSDYLRSLL